jgi:hypothetical protein
MTDTFLRTQLRPKHAPGHRALASWQEKGFSNELFVMLYAPYRLLAVCVGRRKAAIRSLSRGEAEIAQRPNNSIHMLRNHARD